MFTVLVSIHVKPECIDAFCAATLENARLSAREAGIARFELLRQTEDPTRFVLEEMYRDAAAPAAHRETAHYQAWRDSVSGMMAEARTSVRYEPVGA